MRVTETSRLRLEVLHDFQKAVVCSIDSGGTCSWQSVHGTLSCKCSAPRKHPAARLTDVLLVDEHTLHLETAHRHSLEASGAYAAHSAHTNELRRGGTFWSPALT